MIDLISNFVVVDRVPKIVDMGTYSCMYVPILGLFLDFRGRNTRKEGFLTFQRNRTSTPFKNRNMVVHINDHKISPRTKPQAFLWRLYLLKG